MSVAILSSNFYGGTVDELPQAVPRLVLTEATHGIEPDDPRIAVSWWRPRRDRFWPRIASAYWGYHPEIVTDAEIVITIGNNYRIQVPDFADRCVEELGDDDLLVLRHPERDCIYEEAVASQGMWRWNASRQDILGQVRAYRAAGHPEHWGLFHCGMVVRRNTPAMRAFNQVWWAEYRRWSSQNQISLPYLLRTSGLRWHAWPDVGEWHALPYQEGWIRWRDKVGTPRDYLPV